MARILVLLVRSSPHVQKRTTNAPFCHHATYTHEAGIEHPAVFVVELGPSPVTVPEAPVTMTLKSGVELKPKMAPLCQA